MWKSMGQQQHQFGIGEASIAAIAAAASAAIGAGAAIYSNVSTASAQANMADSQAEAAEVEAKSKMDAAAYEERQFRRKAALLLAKQHAIFGASGMDTGSGSPLLQELDSVRQAELEALNIRRGGEVGAAASRFEASMSRYRGNYYRAAITPSVIGGVSSGAGSVLGTWMKYRG